MPRADPNRYRFRSVWRFDVPPETAYAALQETEDYEAWWPEIRSTRRLDEDRVEARIRSVLPYDLVMVLERVREDPETGVLEARMTGDLEGFSRWVITPDGRGGTRLVFEEEAVPQKPVMRRLAPVARPLYRWNHARMMRSAERGLRAYLAGYAAARDT